jgi:hypothetical protein
LAITFIIRNALTLVRYPYFELFLLAAILSEIDVVRKMDKQREMEMEITRDMERGGDGDS